LAKERSPRPRRDKKKNRNRFPKRRRTQAQEPTRGHKSKNLDSEESLPQGRDENRNRTNPKKNDATKTTDPHQRCDPANERSGNQTSPY
jgi:hypothetical protein